MPEQTKRGLFQRFSDASITQKAAAVLGGIMAVFLISLLLALFIGIAFGETDSVAETVAIVRDLFIILLAMQAILISLALVVLILQLASVINLLQTEIKPIATSLQETVQTVKGTTEFISENIAAPVIETTAILGGIRSFANAALKIRRATAKPKETPNDKPE